MPDSILGGDFSVYYLAENRQKRIVWAGSATGTRTVNELYSALQDLFDELTQLDDGTPMSAQTPTEYTIGKIDTGDADPWFIDRESVEHLQGSSTQGAGALKTTGWTRATGTNTGIVRITYTVGTDFITGDIGKTVTNGTSGSTGTLLDFNGTGSTKYAWIRPTNSTATHNWGGTVGTITVTGGSAASVTQATAGVSGESLWANIFSLGTIEPYTHLYIEQNGALLTRYKDSTTDWWRDKSETGVTTDQIDILVNVKECDLEIDEGFIKVFARQHSKTYAYFQVDLTTGGRNPIPLQTGDDLDNTKGYRQMVLTTASAAFTVGEIIKDDSDATIKGIVTSSTGTAPNVTVQYYLIGDPISDFTAGTGGFTGVTSGSTATAVAPTDVNAGNTADTLYDGITVTQGSSEVYDVDENDATENYSIVVNCNSNLLQNVQERLKFITRRGSTGDIDAGSQTTIGQFYLGSDYRIIYNTLTGTISEGAAVTQVSTLATGTVVSHNTADKILILRNSRRTFNTTNEIRLDVAIDANKVTMTGGSATPITPNAASPFGTFAGGKFFGSAGVVLANVPGADAKNYQLTDDNGNVVVPPNKVTISIGNTRAQDKVAVFRVTSGNINKTEYAATGQAAGVTSIIVGTTIATDVPGKTSPGGVLRVVDSSAENEYRLRYTSWSGSTFTLTSFTSTATGGTQTTLIDAGGAFTSGTPVRAKVGDLVYNSTESTYAYVVSVDSATQLTTTNLGSEAPVTNWNGDGYKINALPIASVVSDYVYIPIIDAYETTGADGTGNEGSEEATLTYTSNISVRVVARNAIDTASTTTPMLPYTADATVTSTGLSNNIIRTLDSIKT